jgi:hypothetical protein
MLYENTSTMGTDPRVSRMYFGFYGWRTGVDGLTSWTHPTLGLKTVSHVWAEWKEQRQAMQQYFKDPNWQLPPSTVCWEMVREGIDDARYLAAFEEALASHPPGREKYDNILKELAVDVDAAGMSGKRPECTWNGQRFAGCRMRLIQGLLEMKGFNKIKHPGSM